MKKLLTTTLATAVAAATIAGCGQTGRTISLTQHFNRCTITANARPAADAAGAEQRLTDPMDSASGSVFSQSASMWTETAGNEEGTGRNSTSVPVDLDANLAPATAKTGAAVADAAAALAAKATAAVATDCADCGGND